MKLTSLALGAMAAIAGTFAGDVSAATVTRDHLTHGPANCQAALPVFDGNIRKRPMGIGNEGSGSAFITCGIDDISNSGPGFTTIAVYLRNRAAAANVTVNCTLANGIFANPQLLPKTSTPIAAGSVAAIAWTAAGDNEDTPFGAPGLSCNLPPGIDISAVQTIRQEEIGALEP